MGRFLVDFILVFEFHYFITLYFYKSLNLRNFLLKMYFQNSQAIPKFPDFIYLNQFTPFFS